MKLLPKKSLGQNFLTNTSVSERMVKTGQLESGEHVLEIGPGTGMLTKELLKRGAKVTAIETDGRAIPILEEMFMDEIASGDFVLHHADIRTFDITTLNLKPGEYKLIANIPYYISSMLFRLFLESSFQPSIIVFLVQKEVAERIARDKKESLLSLSIKVYGEATYIQTVKRGNFTPPPNVDSAILSIANISKQNFKHISESAFFKILHLGFAAKRKQLLGNLAKTYNRKQLIHTFSTLGIPLDVRGEDVSIQTWLVLSSELTINTIPTTH